MFSMIIYSSKRRFEVWRWGVGHAMLLLRSVHLKGEPRIGVLFKPAYALCLPQLLLDGLEIAEPHVIGTPEAVRLALGRDLKASDHFYTLKSGAVAGWVVAASLSGRQGDKKASDPTMFDGWSPEEGVVELF